MVCSAKQIEYLLIFFPFPRLWANSRLCSKETDAMFVHRLFKPLLLFALACINIQAEAQTAINPLFKLRDPKQSGIRFVNRLTESDSLNILNQANIYNGGGVGIGDFNNDGLPDIYFAGNMQSNKLYLNKGQLQFDDITAASQTSGNGHWSTGVSVVDINADGWLDIYVSCSFSSDINLRTNLLYINEGLTKDGIPHFKESARAYGLDDTGFSTQGIFFDYDNDGDLDCYLVTNELNDPKTPIRYRPKVVDGTARNTDRLYRNNGDNHFSNVSKEAGIRIEGWGHAVCVSDFNADGWPDIYVANDFISNDLLYINNHDGTFSNQLDDYFRHTAWNAMGTAMADVNNDGLPDMVSLEMLPEKNLRKKRMLAGNEYYNYFNSQKYNYTHQYVRNVLQLNRGITPDGHTIFNDLGYISGIFETDWSWCPMIADFDNDGLRDLVISNGLPRDVTDLDYVTFNNGQGGTGGKYKLAMVDSLPIVKLPNYAFRNINGIQFENHSKDWGFIHPSFSNGAAYADLDKDGDLDIVINNINDVAFLYENRLNQLQPTAMHNRLSIRLEGKAPNLQAFGASIRLYVGKQQYYYEQQPCAGYLSTVTDLAWFSLGAVTTIDSIRVRWPDGNSQLLTQVPSSSQLVLKQAAASAPMPAAAPLQPLLQEVSAAYGIDYKHSERDAIDYNQQASLPHKLSQYGPYLATGDINKDGLEDFVIGASVGRKNVFYIQTSDGHFQADSARIIGNDRHIQEDMGLLLFDAEGDGDLDLYAVSGSYEIAPNSSASQDLLYINDGKGYFTPSSSALPRDYSNGSCVKAADFDGDGDLDLFVGSRGISGAYPLSTGGRLLQNLQGTFTDVTSKYCAALADAGMITDALWSDFDNDGKPDLVITGEWLPIRFYRNTGDGFALVELTELEANSGWWNSLAAGDFDGDGDIDYVAGNLGLNSNYKASQQEPLQLYAKDFDDNGLLDPFVFGYGLAEDGSRKPFPMTVRDDMISQLLPIRKRFPTYKAFGLADMNKILGPTGKEGAVYLKATNMASCYIENKGQGQFAIRPLPLAAQEAPVYGLLPMDVNGDSQLDIILSGNDYGMEPYSGRHDAFNGLVLLGDGQGRFSPLTIQQSGLYIPGDGKALALVKRFDGKPLIIATQNQGKLKLFQPKQ